MPLSGQERDRTDGPASGAWNAPEALALVDRARTLRHRTFVDSALRSYTSEARGYVYFFLDRPSADEQTLIKTDQVALEVFWEAPDRTHQTIVGLRDRETLPTDIRYHLDHLTVVQDEFEDRIRLGDGDEVADVTHPVAPGSERVYDFRVARELTVRFPGGDREAVRVHEIQVRPKDFDLPGFVGSVFLDRASGAIVRMRFTFTPASYVDPYLDYIRISLDNSLWMGRHWLPYRQEAELRREIPQLDFLAGSIIRGRFEIGSYVFNPEIPDRVFQRPRVTAAPEAQRVAFPFEEGIFAQLDAEGLERPGSIEEIRERAREMTQEVYLSGLRRVRLHVPSVSDVYRFNRTEGHTVGLGTSFRPGGDLSVRLLGGWSFGRDRPRAALEASGIEDSAWRIGAYLERPVDVGPFPAAAGVVNTLGGLLLDEDWTDPYFATGGEVGVEVGGGLAFTAFVEKHRSATRVAGEVGDERPVLPAERGSVAGVRARGAWLGGASPVDGWGVAWHAEAAGGIEGVDGYLRQRGSVAWARSERWRALQLSARLDGGWAIDPPPQKLFLIGGRGTLLGQPFRRFVGERFWLLRVEASRELVEPWLGLRLFAGAGQAADAGGLGCCLDEGGEPAGGESAGGAAFLDDDAGAVGSVGVGAALLWDVLHLDLGRGLGPDGRWELAFAVAKRFHGWL